MQNKRQNIFGINDKNESTSNNQKKKDYLNKQHQNIYKSNSKSPVQSHNNIYGKPFQNRSPVQRVNFPIESQLFRAKNHLIENLKNQQSVILKPAMQCREFDKNGMIVNNASPKEQKTQTKTPNMFFLDQKTPSMTPKNIFSKKQQPSPSPSQEIQSQEQQSFQNRQSSGNKNKSNIIQQMNEQHLNLDNTDTQNVIDQNKKNFNLLQCLQNMAPIQNPATVNLKQENTQINSRNSSNQKASNKEDIKKEQSIKNVDSPNVIESRPPLNKVKPQIVKNKSKHNTSEQQQESKSEKLSDSRKSRQRTQNVQNRQEKINIQSDKELTFKSPAHGQNHSQNVKQNQKGNKLLSVVRQNSFQQSIIGNKNSPIIQYSNHSANKQSETGYMDNFSSSNQNNLAYFENCSSTNKTTNNAVGQTKNNKVTSSFIVKNPLSQIQHSEIQFSNNQNHNKKLFNKQKVQNNNAVHVISKMTESVNIEKTNTNPSVKNQKLMKSDNKTHSNDKKKDIKQLKQICKKQQDPQFKNISIIKKVHSQSDSQSLSQSHSFTAKQLTPPKKQVDNKKSMLVKSVEKKQNINQANRLALKCNLVNSAKSIISKVSNQSTQKNTQHQQMLNKRQEKLVSQYQSEQKIPKKHSNEGQNQNAHLGSQKIKKQEILQKQENNSLKSIRTVSIPEKKTPIKQKVDNQTDNIDDGKTVNVSMQYSRSTQLRQTQHLSKNLFSSHLNKSKSQTNLSTHNNSKEQKNDLINSQRKGQIKGDTNNTTIRKNQAQQMKTNQINGLIKRQLQSDQNQNLEVPENNQRKQTATFGMLKENSNIQPNQSSNKPKMNRTISFAQNAFQNNAKKLQNKPEINHSNAQRGSKNVVQQKMQSNSTNINNFNSFNPAQIKQAKGMGIPQENKKQIKAQHKGLPPKPPKIVPKKQSQNQSYTPITHVPMQNKGNKGSPAQQKSDINFSPASRKQSSPQHETSHATFGKKKGPEKYCESEMSDVNQLNEKLIKNFNQEFKDKANLNQQLQEKKLKKQKLQNQIRQKQQAQKKQLAIKQAKLKLQQELSRLKQKKNYYEYMKEKIFDFIVVSRTQLKQIKTITNLTNQNETIIDQSNKLMQKFIFLSIQPVKINSSLNYKMMYDVEFNKFLEHNIRKQAGMQKDIVNLQKVVQRSSSSQINFKNITQNYLKDIEIQKQYLSKQIQIAKINKKQQSIFSICKKKRNKYASKQQQIDNQINNELQKIKPNNCINNFKQQIKYILQQKKNNIAFWYKKFDQISKQQQHYIGDLFTCNSKQYKNLPSNYPPQNQKSIQKSQSNLNGKKKSLLQRIIENKIKIDNSQNSKIQFFQYNWNKKNYKIKSNNKFSLGFKKYLCQSKKNVLNNIFNTQHNQKAYNKPNQQHQNKEQQSNITYSYDAQRLQIQQKYIEYNDLLYGLRAHIGLNQPYKNHESNNQFELNRRRELKQNLFWKSKENISIKLSSYAHLPNVFYVQNGRCIC